MRHVVGETEELLEEFLQAGNAAEEFLEQPPESPLDGCIRDQEAIDVGLGDEQCLQLAAQHAFLVQQDADADAPDRLAFRFVLALILMRKKMVRYDRTELRIALVKPATVEGPPFVGELCAAAPLRGR